jgi:uncharacterized lipoprotein YddW (UPF0748 family)
VRRARRPTKPWDPLAEWVAGAHRRGLELHAWFNPYRARHPSARSENAATHVANTDAAIVKRYGDFLWMDPGEPRAAQRMLDVVLDVLRRYDIDGVHIDDYFYPYPANDAQGAEQPFPDDASYQRHVDGGGRLDRAAWRRDNVDRLVQTLHREIHAVKPWVRFGISPFGLPRPDRRPPGISGFSQYDKLFADVEHVAAAGLAGLPGAAAVLADRRARPGLRAACCRPGATATRRAATCGRACSPAGWVPSAMPTWRPRCWPRSSARAPALRPTTATCTSA